MLYMAKLGPDVITEEINADDDDFSTDTEAAPETCVSIQCQKQIKGGTLGLIIEPNFDLYPDSAAQLGPHVRTAWDFV